jgi:WD40 repeat protein
VIEGGGVTCVAIDPAGERVAVGTGEAERVAGLNDGSILTGALHLFEATASGLHDGGSYVTGSLRDLAFSPDGSRMATIDDHGMLRVWDPVSGELLSEVSDLEQQGRAVEFSPNGQLLATAGTAEWVHVRATDSLDLIWEGKMPLAADILFSHDSRYFFALSRAGLIEVYLCEDFTKVLSFSPVAGVFGMDVSPYDGTIVVSCFREPQRGLIAVAPNRWMTGLEHVTPAPAIPGD